MDSSDTKICVEFVTLNTGLAHLVNLDCNSTIAKAVSIVVSMQPVPIHGYSVMWNNKIIDLRSTFGELGITDGTALQLVPLSFGQQPTSLQSSWWKRAIIKGVATGVSFALVHVFATGSSRKGVTVHLQQRKSA
jgi:hypothetical protein